MTISQFLRAVTVTLLTLAVSTAAVAQIGLQPPPPPPLPNPPQINPPPDPPRVDPPRAPKPDLVIDQMRSDAPNPSTIAVDSTFNVTVRVKNIGAAGANSVNVTLNLPSNVEIAAPPILPNRFRPCQRDGSRLTCSDKSSPMPLPLLYGESVTVTFRLRATAAGGAGFTAAADTLFRVDEDSENNNGGSLNVTLVVRPSLQVTAFTPTQARAKSQKFGVVCTAKNIGTVDATKIGMKVVIKGTDAAGNPSGDITVEQGPRQSCSSSAPSVSVIHHFDCQIGSLKASGSPSETMAMRTFFVTTSEAAAVTLDCSIGAALENSTGDNESTATTQIQ